MRKNPVEQRDLRAAAVLHLRSGRATSRSSLARALAASPSTLGLHVDELIAQGFATESGLDRGAIGRPRRSLALRAQAGWFAGVEFNAERVQVVRVDFAGTVQSSEGRPLPARPDTATVLKRIQQALEKLVKTAGGPPLAIGVGTPGLVDPHSGAALHYSFVRGWRDVPLGPTLQSRFQVPVTLENNLRAIALAERWFGGGRDLNDYVILGPRSGFGVSVMHGGQLLRGAHHAAGEIGRWPWPLDGGRHELHDRLSAPAVYRRLTGLFEDDPLPPDLRAAFLELAESDTAEWQEVIGDYARVIGCLQLLLDTEAFFLHGPLTALGTRFCKAIATAIGGIAPAMARMPLRVLPSDLGDDAGALGAASLAMEAWAPPT
ncbi:MAG TPA: ROK family protein [Prosthecobacter sp.]|nr:ROK family protein [Prosthecobacter sp.]